MNIFSLKKIWYFVRGKVSIVLIVSMILTGISPVNFSHAKDLNYNFIPEIDIDDTLIDDGMFYIPHKNFDVKEGEENNKYVFKVKRKGDIDREEKVKLSMVDMSAKYNRDYNIRVIGSSIFSENVKNTWQSKSLSEYIKDTDVEEYNFSDAVIDGSVNLDDVMTEDEKESYTISDEDKEKLTEDAKAFMEAFDLNEEPEVHAHSNTEETTEESSSMDELHETDESVDASIEDDESGDRETRPCDESSEDNVETSEDNVETSEDNVETSEDNVETSEDYVGASTRPSELLSIESEESATKSPWGTSPEEDITSEETTEESTEETTIETTEHIIEETLPATFSELSDIVTESNMNYELLPPEDGEEVRFDVKKASMSMTEGFEIATGLKDDRKTYIPDRRNTTDILPNPNSINDKVFMSEGIETIEEELKSAYVILDFKAQQVEKLIEITIIDNNKYLGDRQVGFNLSSIDGSDIAGNYQSLTLIIRDDEPEEPSYINFVKSTYEPKDGYITVEVERTGVITGIATCMIDSEDINAKVGRDYSEVHAKLIFGFGVNVRKIKIPVVSIFADDELKFKLKLQVPEGALIGDNGTTTCTIRKKDKTFKFVEEKLNTEIEKTYKSINSSNDNIKTNILTANSTSDIDMDSAVAGETIQLDKYLSWVGSHNCNKNSYHQFEDSGKGFKAYLDNNSIFAEDCGCSWSVNMFNGDRKIKDISGFQVDWSCDSSNADIMIYHYISDNGSFRQHNMYDKYDRSFNSETLNFFFENKKLMPYFTFKIERKDGIYKSSPTITIHSIKPLWRMYNVSLLETIVPKLIDSNGNLTNINEFTSYTAVSFDGAKTDGTVVAWRNKPVTIKLNNVINNPFYIKAVYIKNTATGESKKLAENKNINATTITYRMDENFVDDYDSFIEPIERQGGGWNGRYKIYVELGTKPAEVNLVKDDRVDVKIWNKNPESATSVGGGPLTLNWTFNIGDVLHFTATMKPEYASLFKCDGLNVYREIPYSPEWITIRRPTDTSDYFPLNAEYTRIKVIPAISENNNHIVVKVKKDIVDKFDNTYGLFANATVLENDDYYDYYIAESGSDITGKYFNIKARCLDTNYSPVWQEAHKENTKYIQEEYYFLGTEQIQDNVIYLTYEKGDYIDYSISGTVYYEETPIGGKTVDRYWQEASRIGIIIDDTHFAYTDDSGNFATIPGKGKKGYYKKLKIVSYGVEKYLVVELNQYNRNSKQYVISYEDGDRTITKEVYDVNVEEVLISNVNNVHPHIKGVSVKNVNGENIGASTNAVYINNRITILEAFVQAKRPDDSYYTYTYEDEDGNVITANEETKRVEFIVVDMKSHSIKKVIAATTSNADKTIWTASYTFERGNYAEYMSGDKLYVRIVTDRKVGDGKGYDDTTGSRINIPIFNETTYQAISTIMPFIEEAEQEPTIVSIEFPSDEEARTYSLPLLGNLACMINAAGLSFGIAMDGDRVRLFIGKKFNGGGNRFDGNGRWVSDTGAALTLNNFTDGIKDMRNFIKSSGTKRTRTVTLGLPTWTFEPIVGIYLEFVLYYDPAATVKNRFEFTGGGGYIGAILDLQYTYYFLVYGIPTYVGGDVNISFVGEFGLATDIDTHIALNDPSQSFIDELIKHSHFEFLFRSILYAQAYVGVGIAGSLGVRGGFMLRLMFIYNPFVHKKYRDVSSMGFAVDGFIRLWVDAVLLSVPIPFHNFPSFYKQGYFEDIEKYQDETGGLPLLGTTDENIDEELKPKPRPDGISKFVANESKESNGILGGTYSQYDEEVLVENSYDASEPKFMSYASSDGRINKGLLVYLDDDKSRGDLDRTVLKYATYDAENERWSDSKNVWEGNATADFSPVLCAYDNKILLAWASRPDTVDENTPKADLLKNMEIWTAFFDCENEEFEEVTRMTDDDSYDYYPQVVMDKSTGKLYLYYLKNGNVSDIKSGEDLINNVQTEVNGAYLMYMLYDNPDGNGFRWLRDFYYDYELKSGITEEEKTEFINTWRGQRFVDLSIDIGGSTKKVDNPNINNYAVSASRILVANDAEMAEVKQIYDEYKQIEHPTGDDRWNFMMKLAEFAYYHNRNYNVVAYGVEGDGKIETKNDTEIYLKIKSATESITIRVTNNDVPDTMPKIIRTIDRTYLFWIQNENAIKVTSIDDIVSKARKDGHESHDMVTGNVSIMTTDNVIVSDKISNYYPFVGNDSDNIYLVWQQNSNEIDFENFDPSAKSEFKQDLYVAGLIKSVAADGTRVESWSNPVRFTNNGKVNDLPSAIILNSKMLLVNNQYNLSSGGDEKNYEITNNTLTMTSYKRQSSLSINKVVYDLIESYSNGSRKYQIYVYVNNDGLYMANGYNYSGSITYDGNVLTSIDGTSDDRVIPGTESRIGGYSIVSTESNITPPIYVTLSAEQLRNLDKIKVTLNIVERNVFDGGVTSSKELFDAKEEFAFVVDESETEKESYGNLKVVQVGDDFTVEGVLQNTGKVDAIGNEKIYIIDQDDWENPIASSDYIDLKVGEQLQFSIPIDKKVLGNAKNGVKDLVLYVANDSGNLFSEYEFATVNAKVPYNFKVNGLDKVLTIEVGESINLTSTYEPSDRYKNATVMYSTNDLDVAYVRSNKLTGVSLGTTELVLTTKEFGGSSNIKVNVIPNTPKPTPYNPSGTGSGSGTGGRNIISNGILSGGIIITTTDLTKINTPVFNANDITWVYDPIYNKFKLNLIINGKQVEARNVFVSINELETKTINGASVSIQVNNTYFFDANGNMVTGWVKTADGKWYFFETEKTQNEGKVVTGWKFIDGSWYYFDVDGAMLVNTMTPDGYYVGPDGKLIS